MNTPDSLQYCGSEFSVGFDHKRSPKIGGQGSDLVDEEGSLLQGC